MEVVKVRFSEQFERSSQKHDAILTIETNFPGAPTMRRADGNDATRACQNGGRFAAGTQGRPKTTVPQLEKGGPTQQARNPKLQPGTEPDEP